MSKELVERLRQGITLYSACLENADKHMTLLSEAADRIEQLETDLAEAKDHIEYLILRDDTWKKITEQRDKQLALVTAENGKLLSLLKESVDLIEVFTPSEADVVRKVKAAIAKGDK